MQVYNVKKEKLFVRMQLSFLTNIKLKKGVYLQNNA